MAKSSSQWTGELDELFDRAVFTFEGTVPPVFIYFYTLLYRGIILHVQLTVEL